MIALCGCRSRWFDLGFGKSHDDVDGFHPKFHLSGRGRMQGVNLRSIKFVVRLDRKFNITLSSLRYFGNFHQIDEAIGHL